MADATAEAQRVTTQRLATVGLLASGIAHDYGNVLTAILTRVGLLLERLGDRPDVREELQDIEAMAGWGAALTGQLLSYAHDLPVQPQEIDLNELTGRAERLLRRLIGNRIELTAAQLPEPALIRADPVQVEQVLVNLGINARDAMRSGGRLGIRLEAERPGWVTIVISDTGHGMPPDVLARIPEPRFTTKSNGRGTGLGLAMTYAIVRQNGGEIEITSAPEEGTTFRLYFPRVRNGGSRSRQPA